MAPQRERSSALQNATLDTGDERRKRSKLVRSMQDSRLTYHSNWLVSKLLPRKFSAEIDAIVISYMDFKHFRKLRTDVVFREWTLGNELLDVKNPSSPLLSILPNYRIR